MKTKVRIDKLIFEKGLAPSRERAQAYIMAGKVIVNDQKMEKPGTKVVPDVNIVIKGMDQPYVSRGGLKIEKAIKAFNIPVEGKVGMDVGASTGGFTDCLLQHGTSKVYAIDVGYGQLDWKLVTDDRVINMEKTNFRYVTPEDIGELVDIIVIDVSFISLTKILENCFRFLKPGGVLLALIKPQFEAGKDNIEQGGIVRDPKVREKVVAGIKEHALEVGFEVHDITESPIQGKKSGNIEYLIHLTKNL